MRQEVGRKGRENREREKECVKEMKSIVWDIISYDIIWKYRKKKKDGYIFVILLKFSFEEILFFQRCGKDRRPMQFCENLFCKTTDLQTISSSD